MHKEKTTIVKKKIVKRWIIDIRNKKRHKNMPCRCNQ